MLVLHKFLLRHTRIYIVMHKRFEYIHIKSYKWPILTDLHDFSCILMSLYGIQLILEIFKLIMHGDLSAPS